MDRTKLQQTIDHVKTLFPQPTSFVHACGTTVFNKSYILLRATPDEDRPERALAIIVEVPVHPHRLDVAAFTRCGEKVVHFVPTLAGAFASYEDLMRRFMFSGNVEATFDRFLIRDTPYSKVTLD